MEICRKEHVGRMFSRLIFLGIFAHSMAKQAIAKPIWDAQSETAFVELLCADESYFRKCFEVTQPVCRKTLRQAVKKCAGVTKGVTEMIPLHTKMGLCVGTRVEKSWSDRKSASTDCRNREKWQ